MTIFSETFPLHFFPSSGVIIIIITEIYAAPKLSKYMTALGAYNVKSFTYEINQHMHEHTHTHTHTHIHLSLIHI